MAQNKQNKDHSVLDLVTRFEVMSKSGEVAFFEKTCFDDLIDYYEAEELWEQALTVTNLAILQHPFSSDLFLRKAQLLIDFGRVEEALECLSQAELYDPSELEILLLRAEALNTLERHEDAMNVLNHALEVSDKQNWSEIYMCEAYIHECSEDYDSMLEALKSAANADPENSSALDRIWLCVELSQKFESSVSFHNAFLDEHPYSYQAWYNLGHAYQSLNKFDKAVMAYEYAFLINEEFEFAYRDCAETCLQAGWHDKALQYYMEASEHFTPDADMLTKIGQCYMGIGAVEKAKYFYVQAAQLDPMSSEVLYRMGECFTRQKKWKQAIKSFQKAVMLDGKKEEYTSALAEAYYHSNQLDLALPFYKKTVELAPDQSMYWLQYATFLIEVGEVDEAMLLLDEANSYTNKEDLVIGRIACLFMVGRRQEALTLLSSTLMENSNSLESLFEFAPSLKTDQDVIDTIAFFKE